MRRSVFLLLALLLCLATPSTAESLEDTIVSSLEREGYVRILRTKTLLGRVRIVALRQGHLREVVINPSTSEILRDVEVRSDKIPVIPERKSGAQDDG